MPNYNILMGQGLVVNNLVGSTIYTGTSGAHPNNGLITCSAVVLVNPAQGTGGMYHYAAGPLANNAQAKTILTQMAQAVQPTEAWVYFGPFPGPENMGYHDLANFLHAFVQTVKIRPATTGAVSVTVTQGHATQIGTAQVVCDVDLANVQPGVKPYGRLYS